DAGHLHTTLHQCVDPRPTSGAPAGLPCAEAVAGASREAARYLSAHCAIPGAVPGDRFGKKSISVRGIALVLTTDAYCPPSTEDHCRTAEGSGRALVPDEEISHAAALSSL